MPRLPPLTELRAFEAAARHLSFRAAAEELGVTPTAVSHQIRLLELYCGRPLFRRRPRPLSLTNAGTQLFPVVHDGLGRCAEVLGEIRGGSSHRRLRVTSTNAFAARWLLPRLPLWREANPRIGLDVVGTDAVLDLKGGETDVAIRYARTPPSGFVLLELTRDRFHVVASPSLVGLGAKRLTPAQLASFPLIACEWPETDHHAPTWERWEKAARSRHRAVPGLASLVTLSFREEPHAIEAVMAGQGIGICSDVIVGRELAAGTLVRLSTISLAGYAFYGIYRANHPRRALIESFLRWMRDLLECSKSQRLPIRAG
jgi:LysR family transcriptional regulator, glycine cleavage system transcriptional activator